MSTCFARRNKLNCSFQNILERENARHTGVLSLMKRHATKTMF